MTKRCVDCRRHTLTVDPLGENAPVYYCAIQGIVLDASRLSGPTCPEARFYTFEPRPAKRPRSSRS